MIKPVVSIIVPVYNVEPYILECLESVGNQTIQQLLECIIVDDCGMDNSASIAKQYISTYQGKVTFHFVQRERNGGLSAARNSGVRAAKGKYLYFLDSDDYLIPTALETLVSLVEKYGEVDLLPALYITGKGHQMEQFGLSSFPEFSDNQHQIKRALLDYDCIPVTAANRLVRRKMFLDNNLWFKEGIIHEDNYWTFFLAKCVKKMAFCAQKIYFYRETPGSITKSKNLVKEAFAFKTLLSDFIDNIDKFEEGAQKKYIFLHTLVMLNNGFYGNGEDKNFLLQKFLKHCSLIERIPLFIVYHTSGLVHNKGINLIQRIFLM